MNKDIVMPTCELNYLEADIYNQIKSLNERILVLEGRAYRFECEKCNKIVVKDSLIMPDGWWYRGGIKYRCDTCSTQPAVKTPPEGTLCAKCKHPWGTTHHAFSHEHQWCDGETDAPDGKCHCEKFMVTCFEDNIESSELILRPFKSGSNIFNQPKYAIGDTIERGEYNDIGVITYIVQYSDGDVSYRVRHSISGDEFWWAEDMCHPFVATRWEPVTVVCESSEGGMSRQEICKCGHTEQDHRTGPCDGDECDCDDFMRLDREVVI